MAVCKFFMQGNCQYGEKCWNEHPQGGARGGGSAKTVSFRNSFTANQNPFNTLGQSSGSGQSNSSSNNSNSQQPLLNASSQDIMSTISSEMQTWDKSKMWPFSCFTYWKECSCMPEFDDISPEELRHEAYDAQKTNTFQQFVRKVADMKNKLQQLRNELIRPNMQTKQKLIQLFEDEKMKIQSRPQDTSSNPFQGQPTGTFSSNAMSGVFGGSSQQTTTSVFGGGPSTASAAGSNVFGSTVPFDLSKRVFGGLTQPASNGFGTGAAMQSNTIFGGSGASTTVQSNPVFGGQIAAGASGGTNTNVFGNASASGMSGVFGAPATQSASAEGLFGSSTTSVAGTGVFGSGSANTIATTHSSSVFGGGGGSVFGGPSAISVQPPSTTGFDSAGNVFGGGQASVPSTFTQNPTNNTGSGFGGSAFNSGDIGAAGLVNPGQASSVFGGSIRNTPSSQNQVISTVYTPLSELTAEEKTAFEADRFILGQIPCRPPPKELC